MARTLGSYAKLTKPKISEIALHLFAERGYAAVSMRQIASKVGLQVGALYNYFPDKQTILSELLISHMENLLQSWHRQNLPEKPDKLLEFFVDFHIEHHLNRPEEVFIAYMELRNLNPDNFFYFVNNHFNTKVITVVLLFLYLHNVRFISFNDLKNQLK